MPGTDASPSTAAGGYAAPPPSSRARLGSAGHDAPARGGAPASAPGNAARAEKLWNIGWVMVGAAAVFVVSLLLPWLGADPAATPGAEPAVLYGYEWYTAQFAAVVAVGLGAYGLQALTGPRVRFHVVAMIGLYVVLACSLFGFFVPEDSAVEALGLEGRGVEVGDTSSANAGLVQLRYGEMIAAGAALVMILPLTVLWRDAREQQREAAPSVVGDAVSAQSPPPPPPAPGA